MKDRIVAGLVAVLLVAGALVLRGVIVGDGSGGGKGNVDPGSGLPVVACTPDLDEVCAQLAAAKVIAPQPPTLEVDGAAKPDAAIDAWITWDPGPRVADFGDQTNTLWQPASAVATGRLAASADGEAWGQSCGTRDAWTCIGRAPDQGLSVGVGDPSTSESLARLAPFATGEIDATVAKAQRLVDSPQGGQSTSIEMATDLATKPGAVDLVVGPLPVLATAAGAPQAQRRGIEVRRPDPDANATVVIAEREGRDGPSAAKVCEAAAPALEAVGAPTCGGKLLSERVAGLLYQVHRRLG